MRELLAYWESLFGREPRTELQYNDDFELLVAVMLSAQCTDKRVNTVTPELFQLWPNIKAMSQANVRDVERVIYSCGFYRAKARNLIAMSRMVIEQFDGKIPHTVDELAKLPGVGLKTAGVFVAEFLGEPAFPVDTHIGRVARKLGLTVQTNPDKVSLDLQALFPREDWARAHLYMVLFGRYYCTSRAPKCDNCGIISSCFWTKQR